MLFSKIGLNRFLYFHGLDCKSNVFVVCPRIFLDSNSNELLELRKGGMLHECPLEAFV